MPFTGSLVFVLCCAWALAPIGIAQNVPPAPNPDDSGPTIEYTMKYIRDRLDSVDIAWTSVAHTQSGDRHYATKYNVSQAEADPKRCTLGFRGTYYIDDRDSAAAVTISDTSTKFSMHDVERVLVEPRSAVDKRTNAMFDYSPDVYSVTMKMASGKTANLHLRIQGNGVSERDLTNVEVHVDLLDEELANRLAKALIHGVELCGGGDKDPFK